MLLEASTDEAVERRGVEDALEGPLPNDDDVDTEDAAKVLPSIEEDDEVALHSPKPA